LTVTIGYCGTVSGVLVPLETELEEGKLRIPFPMP
jgi:hypothetical protein